MYTARASNPPNEDSLRVLDPAGFSPARMLLRVRLARAAELLSTTGLPLKEVGLRIGMANLSAFGRAFRAWYGITPGEFRRNSHRRHRGISLAGSVAGIV